MSDEINDLRDKINWMHKGNMPKVKQQLKVHFKLIVYQAVS